MLKGFVQYCIYERLIPTWPIGRGMRALGWSSAAIRAHGVCLMSADNVPKTKNRPACVWLTLIPQFQNDLKVKTFLSISKPMPAKLLQSLLQSRSFSRSWSGRGSGSTKQKHAKPTRNVEKDRGRTWFAKLEWGERKLGKRKGNPEKGMRGLWGWLWQKWKYDCSETVYNTWTTLRYTKKCTTKFLFVSKFSARMGSLQKKCSRFFWLEPASTQ